MVVRLISVTMAWARASVWRASEEERVVVRGVGGRERSCLRAEGRKVRREGNIYEMWKKHKNIHEK